MRIEKGTKTNRYLKPKLDAVVCQNNTNPKGTEYIKRVIKNFEYSFFNKPAVIKYIEKGMTGVMKTKPNSEEKITLIALMSKVSKFVNKLTGFTKFDSSLNFSLETSYIFPGLNVINPYKKYEWAQKAKQPINLPKYRNGFMYKAFIYCFLLEIKRKNTGVKNRR